jgi:Ras-related protein Rab-5C
MKHWVKDIRTNQNAPRNLIIAIVGNKIDGKRVIDSVTGSDYAAENGLLFFETSAKTGEGVKEVFEALAQKFRKLNESKKA